MSPFDDHILFYNIMSWKSGVLAYVNDGSNIRFYLRMRAEFNTGDKCVQAFNLFEYGIYKVMGGARIVTFMVFTNI